MLRLAADLYLRYLKTNDEAVAAGVASISFEWEGLKYTQAPFKYHAKCYRILREKFTALSSQARADVEAALGDHAKFLTTTETK